MNYLRSLVWLKIQFSCEESTLGLKIVYTSEYWPDKRVTFISFGLDMNAMKRFWFLCSQEDGTEEVSHGDT